MRQWQLSHTQSDSCQWDSDNHTDSCQWVSDWVTEWVTALTVLLWQWLWLWLCLWLRLFVLNIKTKKKINSKTQKSDGWFKFIKKKIILNLYKKLVNFSLFYYYAAARVRGPRSALRLVVKAFIRSFLPVNYYFNIINVPQSHQSESDSHSHSRGTAVPHWHPQWQWQLSVTESGVSQWLC